jgi:hypothetical protein
MQAAATHGRPGARLARVPVRAPALRGELCALRGAWRGTAVQTGVDADGGRAGSPELARAEYRCAHSPSVSLAPDLHQVGCKSFGACMLACRHFSRTSHPKYRGFGGGAERRRANAARRRLRLRLILHQIGCRRGRRPGRQPGARPARAPVRAAPARLPSGYSGRRETTAGTLTQYTANLEAGGQPSKRSVRHHAAR